MKFLILITLIAACSAQGLRVKLDIFYESLCPDTHAFIQQLWAVYPTFRENLDITFYPFGKSESAVNNDGEVTFTCRNRGADECFGNRVQGCVLRYLGEQDAQMEYVACQMAPGADPTHETCVQGRLAWYPVYECATNDISEAQQLTFERISAPVIGTTDFVPTVLYNGKLTNDSITWGARPIQEVICSHINNSNPACNA